MLQNFKIVDFPLWRRDPGLELQIAAAVVRNFILLSNSDNSVSADRNGMAASRFLAAAAAGVILLCFAAESPKSQCNSFMDAI